MTSTVGFVQRPFISSPPFISSIISSIYFIHLLQSSNSPPPLVNSSPPLSHSYPDHGSNAAPSWRQPALNIAPVKASFDDKRGTTRSVFLRRDTISRRDSV